MFLKLLGVESSLPLWLFGLRIAARFSNLMMLIFGLFLLFVTDRNLLIVGYALLILTFSMVNLRAISLAKRGTFAAIQRMRLPAHLLSAALPVAYVVGVMYTGAFGDFALQQAIAVAALAILYWLAIEESVRFYHRPTATSET